MTDQIRLAGISALGRHGVLDFERARGQLFTVDVVMDLDLRPAGISDDLDETVNYAEVAHDVVALISGEPFDLIEALAERIADTVLARPLVEAVTVTVHKPQAPVGVPFGDVSVCVRRAVDVPFVLALGSNLGDREAHLTRAYTALSEAPSVTLTGVSGLHETAPVGGPEQGPYLNAVVTGRTRLSPERLLELANSLEDAAGRVREERWGPRTLDVDVITYGDLTSDDATLTLPHPRAAERGFVLQPWAEADPYATLTVAGSPRLVRDLAAEHPPVESQPWVGRP